MTVLKEIQKLQKKMKDMRKQSLLQAKLLNKELKRLENVKRKYVSNQKRTNPVVYPVRSNMIQRYANKGLLPRPRSKKSCAN